ncbi:SanA/YdcF family protein [Wenjunlia tyrosinilytica]|uniref:Membrane protein n=1 Tax=Wenjunlia tyrosinilytica TaxID=1544741 RepID=A0A917ZKE1_9ACTN|nr:ElyC/SanA/YdcF family protein [Wenjunlia tyrosinilytica]GGO84528.1 membrane protein [Wenjunlia tyrosinilytica]
MGRAARWVEGFSRALAGRRGQRRAFQVLTLVTVAALLPITWLFVSADSLVTDVEDAPSAPVAVVFGAGLYAGGKPSPYLAGRLNAAAKLYRKGTVQAVLVTGDNSRTDYDEPTAMRSYLVRRGVPRDRIADDYAGFDTWDSCTRAKRIFGVDKALLVSQSFHIRRAVALCRAAGIDVHGVAVENEHDATWWYGGAREVVAAAKAAWDASVRPAPRFLGPREHSVDKALSASR